MIFFAELTLEFAELSRFFAELMLGFAGLISILAELMLEFAELISIFAELMLGFAELNQSATLIPAPRASLSPPPPRDKPSHAEPKKPNP